MKCVGKDTLDHIGECKVIIDEFCALVDCSEEYLPVCGKSGKTFKNECYMKCVGKDILDHRGEC